MVFAFVFDWTINVSALVTGLFATGTVVVTLIKLGQKFVHFMCTDHWRVTTMWGTYVREYPQDLAEALRQDAAKNR